jgi:hypothetical protein
MGVGTLKENGAGRAGLRDYPAAALSIQELRI